jgi:Domain of unknown function (DUF4148)
MKALIYATLALGAIASPMLSFAQTTNGPVTRAEVRAELVRLEKAGYNPSAGDQTNYPGDIQAAEARAAAQDAARAPGASTSGATSSVAAKAAGADEGSLAASAEGGSPAGTSMSGLPMDKSHQRGTQCVGPADFCAPYFGG